MQAVIAQLLAGPIHFLSFPALPMSLNGFRDGYALHWEESHSSIVSDDFFSGGHLLLKRHQSVKSKRFVLKELKCKRSKESVTRISVVMQHYLAHCLWTYLCPLLDHYCLAPYKCPLFDHCCLPTLEASFWLCEYLTRLSCPLRHFAKIKKSCDSSYYL